MKSLYWSILPAALASSAALARWVLQGSGNVYTDVGKGLYISDPDLGWRLTSTSIAWLGLDAVLATVVFAIGAALVCALLLRSERKSQLVRPKLRMALRALAPVSLVVPIWAFASGGAPEGARDQLPEQTFASAPEGGQAGRLPSNAAGPYEIREHVGTQVTASVRAGGESFEARFAGAPQGFLKFDPAGLSQPMSAEVSVASASVDTGIELRSKHAREELHTERFPRLRFTLDSLESSAQQGPETLTFSAKGSVTLMGKTQPTQVAGTLSAPDADARTRLGFPDQDVLLAKANFSISLAESAIENDGIFDSDIIPVQVSLVLVRENRN